MSQSNIRLKRSSVSGKRPSISNLELGEIALNFYDGNLYTIQDTSGVGIATTVTNLTPWAENYGGSGIEYAGNVSIGGTLSTGAYLFPTSDGTDGQVIKTNGNGTLSFGKANPGNGVKQRGVTVGYGITIFDFVGNLGNVTVDAGDSGIATVSISDNITIDGNLSVAGVSTFTGDANFGDVSIGGTLSLSGLFKETVISSATAATGTINFDVLTQQNLFYTSNATADWTINFRGNSSNTLNNTLSNDEMITVTHMVTVGTSEYRNSVVQVDGTGTGVTVNWLGGSAPAEGIVSSVNVYTYSILKTAASTYTIFANVTQYG